MTETDALYVGADNQTGTIDRDRLAGIMAKHVAGFTIIESEGYWHGMTEPSAVIMVTDDHDHISEAVADIKTELGQDAVGVQRMPDVTFQ
jgi:hypothetical protein